MDQWLLNRQVPLHIVAVAGLVYKDDKVLLIRSENKGWEITGGVLEQGEKLLDGLQREIFEESGIKALPLNMVGVYQRLSFKKGYGLLEGTILPPTVNFTFRCRYLSGQPQTSDESLEVGWFTPQEAKEKISDPYIRQTLIDILQYEDHQFFRSFIIDGQGQKVFLEDCALKVSD